MIERPQLLARLVTAAQGGQAEAALAILLPRLTAALDETNLDAEFLEPFDRFEWDSYDIADEEAFIAVTLAVLASWADSGGALRSRVDALDAASGALRSRLLAQHLRVSPELEVEPDEIAGLLASEMSAHRAHPEGIALAKALFDLRGEDVDACLLDALGTAPSPLEVAEYPSEDRMPADWTRAQGWLVAFPEDRRGAWSAPGAVLDARIGRPPEDGRLVGDVTIFSGPTSPYDVAALEAMGVPEAAERIGAWRPPTEGHWNPTPRGLERTLAEAVKRNAGAWAAEPIETVSRLRHATYVAGYFEGLAATAAEVTAAGSTLASAVLLVHSEPWGVAILGRDSFDADLDWSTAKDAGIKLLQNLWRADADLGAYGDSAWELVRAAAEDRSAPTAVTGASVDDLTAALNRPFTRALDAAFAFGDAERRRTKEFPTAVLDLVRQSLLLRGAEGAHARAMIAPRASFLRRVVPGWFAENRELLFGRDAPDDLGPRTFDNYLKWGNADSQFLDELRPAFVAAVRRQADRALDHVLVGMLWQLPGYTPDAVLDELAPAGPAVVSAAGETLARMVRNVDPGPPIEVAVAFWRAALARAFPSEAYGDFGWMAEVGAIDEDAWLGLMLATTDATGNALDWGQRVAERAAQSPLDPRAITILANLLKTDAELWHQHRIAEAGLRVLRASRSLGPVNEREERRRLQQRLLDRGYFDARDIP